MLEDQDQLLYLLLVGILENFIYDSNSHWARMKATAVNYGHPSNARKCQRVTCIHWLVWRCGIILGIFPGALPDFWVSIFGTIRSLGIIQISGYCCWYFILNDIVECSLQGSGHLFSSVRFKVQMKCFFFITEFERAAKIRKIAIYRF